MKIIKSLTICILLFISFNKGYAQNNDKILLTITVYESIDKGYNKILVLKNEEKLEEIEMQPFSYKDLSSHQLEINKTILKYIKGGYKKESELRGSISCMGNILVMVTTYSFEK